MRFTARSISQYRFADMTAAFFIVFDSPRNRTRLRREWHGLMPTAACRSASHDRESARSIQLGLMVPT